MILEPCCLCTAGFQWLLEGYAAHSSPPFLARRGLRLEASIIMPPLIPLKPQAQPNVTGVPHTSEA